MTMLEPDEELFRKIDDLIDKRLTGIRVQERERAAKIVEEESDCGPAGPNWAEVAAKIRAGNDHVVYDCSKCLVAHRMESKVGQAHYKEFALED